MPAAPDLFQYHPHDDSADSQSICRDTANPVPIYNRQASHQHLNPCSYFYPPQPTSVDSDQLEKICALGIRISSANNLDELLNGYLHELVQGIGAQGGAVRLYNEQSELQLVEAYGLDPGFVDLERRRPASQCVCAAAAKQQQIKCRSNLNHCTRKIGRNPSPHRPGLTMLAVPVTDGPCTLGLFNLYLDHQLTANWTNLPRILSLLGQQLGGAITRIQRQQAEHKNSIHQERLLLAHELHDTIVQEVSVLRLHTRHLDNSAALEEAGMAQLRERIHQLRERIDATHDQVREVMQQFYSQALGAELETALQRLINRFRRDSQINVRLINKWPQTALEERQELHIHRVVEEALANAWHHGQAKNILVLLEADETELHLLIEDDGKGFIDTSARSGRRSPDRQPAEQIQGYGLPGMRERARQTGALLQIDSEPDQGTRIHLHLASNHNRTWLNQGQSQDEEYQDARTPC